MQLCPHCGAELARDARFCRECGSDERTGWSDEAEGGAWEAPALDDFDYEGFLERELPGSAPRARRVRARELRRLAWVALLLLFLWVVLTR